MNTLRPLLIVAVLAGIGYGVYVRINGGNDAPPPEVGEGWDSATSVQCPRRAIDPQCIVGTWQRPRGRKPDDRSAVRPRA